MERTTIEEASLIFKDNFIGLEQLTSIFSHFLPNKKTIVQIPSITWSEKTLRHLANDYILILGIPQWGDIPITIRNLRDCFGLNPDVSEPCFYNQDWYLNEPFIDETLDLKWYLVRKTVFDDSRAVDPNLLIATKQSFPSAILCCYTFFAFWLSRGNKLWETDFVWCSNLDHNGDRIYVGKYRDVDGINKNGFSIHRHLALRSCYAAIDAF